MPIRIQGTYISEEEIKAIVNHTIEQQKAQYDETLIMDEEEMHAATMVEEKMLLKNLFMMKLLNLL